MQHGENILMPRCFHVSLFHRVFLPTSSGKHHFFFIFRIVRRRDSPMDNNLAHISQQVRTGLSRWGAAESYLSLDFNGFKNLDDSKPKSSEATGFFEKFHHQSSVCGRENLLPGLWAYYPPICCHLARWTHGGTTRGKRDTLVWVKRLNARL